MKTDGGFTLIELLVSMTLLGLVFVLLFGGMRFGMRAWERNTISADASDSIRSVQELLRGEIERTCPRRIFSVRGVPIVPQVVFAGSAHALSLIGPVPGGNRCENVSIVAAGDGNLLRLAFRTGSGSVSNLLRRVRSIDIAYLGPAGWRNNWTGQTDLPALVRVRLVFPKDDGRVWPELFAAPRISAEADCTYDPISKSCRGG